MVRTLTLFVFFVALIGCSSADSGVERESDSVESVVADTLSLDKLEETICVPENIDGFLGLIQSSSIGIATVESAVPDVSELSKYDIQEVDQIIPSVTGEETTVKVYHLYYNMSEVMFLTTALDNPYVISGITTYDKRFSTPDCITVGKTFKEFLAVYSISRIDFNYEDRMVYVQCNELGGVKFAFPESIIVNLDQVDQLGGVVNIDNVTTDATIINITI